MCHTTRCPSLIPRPGSAQEKSGNKTTSCSLLDSSVAVKPDPVVGVGHEVDEDATGTVDHLPTSRVQECNHHFINWREKREGRSGGSIHSVPSLVT